MIGPIPGPRSREVAEVLAAHEAPGINTLPGGDPALAGPAWAEALGANVLDVDGNRFLDLTSGFGVAAIGHRHPRVTAAIRRQSARLIHGLGDVHPHRARAELAARLAARVPVDRPRIHFAISGAEAVEIALKTARAATGRSSVLCFDPAYHGLTLGALAATSRRAFREPFAPWLGIPVVRRPYGEDPAQLARVLSAGEEVAAVLFEPVVGREGVLFPPPGWLAEVAGAARQHGALVIADEIFTGFGRTGRWFGVDADSVRPDLLVCGKALGGGLPLAAVAGREELLSRAWSTPGEALHTATFVAHPLACAAALATLDVLEGEALPERAQRMGGAVEARMRSWEGRFPGLVEVRGRGLLWGLELASAALAKAVAANLLARGVLILAGGAGGQVLQLVPPLTIRRRQLGAALDRLEKALEEETS